MKAVQTKHELDALFNVVPGRTEVFIPGSDVAVSTAVEGEIMDPETESDGTTAMDSYDAKDDEIEGQVDDVYGRAIEAHETQMINAQTVTDKKYAPRNAEVAADFLKIALEALKEKNAIKDRKDKLASKVEGKGGGKQITNNIVTDRNTLMKLLKEQQDG